MQKVSWMDRVKNEVLHGFKEERNILRTVKRGRLCCNEKHGW
jgi:hypothetical protein